MSRYKLSLHLCLPLLLFMVTGTAKATALSVNCGKSSIGAALKTLQNVPGPNTINVSGSCHENILIQNVNLLTIAGTNGASISDASNGTKDVVDVLTSRVTITGLTIDGLGSVNFDAVDCEQDSDCTLIDDTLQGSADGVGVYAVSKARIYGGILRNNTSTGLFTRGDAAAYGVTIQGNPTGVLVLRGGRMFINLFPHTSTVTIVSNNGLGIQVQEGAQFQCNGCVVEDNTGDGIHLDVSAAATIVPGFSDDGTTLKAAITRNTGFGVYVGDLSSAAFHGSPVVTGNGQPDILCNSPTAVTRGALKVAGGGTTNCTN
jgi:hypothetical protein